MSPIVLDVLRFEATEFLDAVMRSTVMFLRGVMFEDHQDTLERQFCHVSSGRLHQSIAGRSSFVDSCDETRPKSYCICTIHSVQELFFEYASFFDGDGFCKNLFFLFQWFRLSPLESLLEARIATSFSLCNHFMLRIQCCNLSQF